MTVPAPKTPIAFTTSTSDSSSRQTFTPEITPTSTPNPEAERSSPGNSTRRMDSVKSEIPADKEQPGDRVQETEIKTETASEHKGHGEKVTKCCGHRHHKSCKKAKTKKSKKEERESSSSSSSSSESSSSGSDEEDEASDSDDSSSEDEKAARRRKKAKKQKKKNKRRSRREPSDSEDEDEGDAESSEEEDVRHKKRSSGKKASRKSRRVEESEASEAETDDDDPAQATQAQLRALQLSERKLQRQLNRAKSKKVKGKSAKRASSSKPAYFRGDELWDREIHDYRLTPTSERVDEDDYGEYVFHVRRRFDWEGKYTDTVVDIKSKTLRNSLKNVMASCKLVSLAEETPTIDPDQLFLYLEDIRTYRKELKTKLKNEKKKKTKKSLKEQIAQLKCLLKYLDKDYAKTKKTLYPMLEAGNITFELLWALFRSDTICYASTYTATDEPRAFKVEYATKESSFVKGTWVEVEGRYMDFDGKTFGLGSMDVEIESFKGPRKINSLPCYPLKYHKDPESIKAKLIERGKKFTELAGMQYKFHKGISFTKRKRQAIKVTTNGRVMIDPATFRRTNPNYPISTVKPPDPGVMQAMQGEDESDSDEGGCCCGGGSSDDDEAGRANTFEEGGANDEPRKQGRLIVDKAGRAHFVQVEVDEHGLEIKKENMERIADGAERQRDFSEEELLIASPVVLGFAFSEKLWLEFTVSGIHAIEWNEGAFESLVLPERQKSIVKALVQSHTSEAAERKNIDDVIQGKGRGLVAVLHGSPGVGKTLTAESIAELLKCPLYCVSAGELGTNPRELEQELQKILDLAHAWGAVLLLDEADVFLEARTAQDIHRNALVSIFLRLLEYFQGILFLTTNRVTTFDDAFQSRIHIALRYQELDFKARRAIFEMFLNRVAQMEQQHKARAAALAAPSPSPANPPSDASSSTATASTAPTATTGTTPPSTAAPAPSPPPKPTATAHHSFAPDDLDRLARRNNLNGRQIKNAVRSAQALAVNAGEDLAVGHLLQVLDVAESFERDLKGGSGYTDAMRSYM